MKSSNRALPIPALAYTLAAVLSLPLTAAASPLQGAGGVGCQETKLWANNGESNDYYGISVAVDGDVLVVGAPGFDGAQNNSGGAFVYTRGGATWSLRDVLWPIDGATNDAFGHVAIDGDLIVVGAPDENGGRGSAYVFRRDENGTPADPSDDFWSEETKLAPVNLAVNDDFGGGVSIHGNLIAVLAYGSNGESAHHGWVYVFGAGPAWTLLDEIPWPEGVPMTSVSIHGSTVVAGATGASGAVGGSGAAYVFKPNIPGCPPGQWCLQQKVWASDGAFADNFGRSIAFDGGAFVVGAYFDDENGVDSGSAYVFQHDGTSWTQQDKLVASDGAAVDLFGNSVSISGDTLVVGAQSDDNDNSCAPSCPDNQGAAYVFHRAGSVWYEQAKLMAGDATDSIFFGCSVSMDGDTIASGAILGLGHANNVTGAAYVFAPPASAPSLVRVSLGQGGVEGNSTSFVAGVSQDARFVAFESWADNLVPGDTNGEVDIFVHDRLAVTTDRVNVDSNGDQANSGSQGDSISGDGRYVAFSSWADNLVPGDTNAEIDVFVHDRLAGTTERVSVDSSGTEANGTSMNGSLSGDGRYVAFGSTADNLVQGDTNGDPASGTGLDVFVRDRWSGTTIRASVDSAGIQGNGDSESPEISADGRFVAFGSGATNLVDVDTNAPFGDVFVHDLQTGETTLESVSSNGIQGNSGSGENAISADGRFVAFASSATNLVGGDSNGFVDVFVRDRLFGQTERVSVSSGGFEWNLDSWLGSISGDGRFVTFIVTGDDTGYEEPFLHDRLGGETTPIDVNACGEQGNARAGMAILSGDGSQVAFDSASTNLVWGDPYFMPNVYLREVVPSQVVATGQPSTTSSVHFGGTVIGSSAGGGAAISAPAAGTARVLSPRSICTGSSSSRGCVPILTITGTPRAGDSFAIEARGVHLGRPGVLLYGFAAGASTLQRGTLCIRPPIRRLLPAGSVHATGADLCAGTLSVDFGRHVASGADPLLSAGASVVAQWYQPDPAAPGGGALSAAERFVLQP